MLEHGSVDGLLISADDLTDLLAVLEQDEGGHGTDAELLGHVRHLVHVDLVEAHVRVLIGQIGNVWRDHFARPAPGGVAVDEQRRGVRDRRVEIVFAAREELVEWGTKRGIDGWRFEGNEVGSGGETSVCA